MTKRSYHHGDLRRALLDAAADFLLTNDVTALNLQVVAKAAGVSAGAPYHHFEDKVCLLAALATEGFAELFVTLERQIARALEAGDKLRALVSGYLAFAEKHPAHYRVMFLSDVGDRARFVELHATSGKSLALSVQVLSACLPELPHKQVAARAVAVWSTCHGFASLRAAGVLTNIPGIPALSELRRATIEQAVRCVLC